MMLVVGRLNCQCKETKQWLRNEREKKRADKQCLRKNSGLKEKIYRKEGLSRSP